MTTLAFYRQQAARQQAEADQAILVNVRALAQTAANAWTALGDRLERHTATKLAREGRERSRLQEPSENPDGDFIVPRSVAPGLFDNHTFR